MEDQSEDKDVWLLAKQHLQQLNTASCYPRGYWICYHIHETCTCHLGPGVADIREHIRQQWEQERNVLSHQLRYHCLTHWLDQDLHTKKELKSFWKPCNAEPRQLNWRTDSEHSANWTIKHTYGREQENRKKKSLSQNSANTYFLH